jgi:ubiquinone/menaquinone biosynthesis C-methylase UbiE
MSKAAIACCCDFALQYEKNSHPALRTLERSVLGCDYGGTSWTTRNQAEEIAPMLRLDRSSRYLEIGSGSGWPSVYVAARSRCRLTLLDLPMIALRQARERAVSESLERAAWAVSASGAQIPFADASFDALGHSDVLCCLPEKREMLEECRRVVRDGARMLFYVIAPAPGLEGKEAAAATEAGPPYVDLEISYGDLLAQTGWRLLKLESFTEEYRRSLGRMVAGLESGADELTDVMGEDEFPEVLARRRQQRAAVRDGLLVRESYLAQAI